MDGVLVVGEPAPDVVAASLDMTPTIEAIDAQSVAILGAMENQGRSSHHGRSRQLRAGQDELARTEDEPAEASVPAVPQTTTVPTDSSPGEVLANIFVGLAAGLALAALLNTFRVRIDTVTPRAELRALDPSPE
jgi:hypothetical protein